MDQPGHGQRGFYGVALRLLSSQSTRDDNLCASIISFVPRLLWLKALERERLLYSSLHRSVYLKVFLNSFLLMMKGKPVKNTYGIIFPRTCCRCRLLNAWETDLHNVARAIKRKRIKLICHGMIRHGWIFMI